MASCWMSAAAFVPLWHLNGLSPWLLQKHISSSQTQTLLCEATPARAIRLNSTSC